MDLNDIRAEINEVDKQLQELFTKRMELCGKVADYKIANGLPVFQKDREKQVIANVTEGAPEGLQGATRVYFQTMMDISKCLQYRKMFDNTGFIPFKKLDLSGRHRVAVPGTFGSYNHIACSELFEDADTMFFDNFEEIFKAVSAGAAEFGILPIINSTAGSVVQTYELMRQYDFKICAQAKLKISHCLAARKGVRLEDIHDIYSHEQALRQCSDLINRGAYKAHSFSNTSLAACYVKESTEPCAAICSEKCAEDLGLEILRRSVQNAAENYTKFILISHETFKADNADTISVCLALPHQSSSLYRLLTKFSVAGLNMTMIESMPIANTEFDVMFYLDFKGDIGKKEVTTLLSELSHELSYFKFLGNYKEV